MPVEIVDAPLPSRSMATSTSVSLVLRFTVAVRMAVSFICAPFIRGLRDSPQSGYSGRTDPKSEVSCRCRAPAAPLASASRRSGSAIRSIARPTGRSRRRRPGSGSTPGRHRHRPRADRPSVTVRSWPVVSSLNSTCAPMVTRPGGTMVEGTMVAREISRDRNAAVSGCLSATAVTSRSRRSKSMPLIMIDGSSLRAEGTGSPCGRGDDG